MLTLATEVAANCQTNGWQQVAMYAIGALLVGFIIWAVFR